MKLARPLIVALLTFAAVVSAVAVAAANGTAAGPGIVQLPPEILVDRHLLRAERLLGAGDPAAALEAMNEILALQEEHDLLLPDDFDFQYAQAALRRRAERRRIRRRAEAERRCAARWPPGHVFRDCETCPEMVVLPRSIVALGRYKVTVGEYRAFAAATGGGAGGGCRSFSSDGDHSWRNPSFPQTDRHPVTCMSRDDAQAYVFWLSRTTRVPYRLPTLEELAGAAEASQPGCHRDRTGREGTCPVGAYGPNHLGLSDLLGNVLEWTSRCVDGDCGRRQRHGGHWANPSSLFLPSTRAHTGRGRRTAFRQDHDGDQPTAREP